MRLSIREKIMLLALGVAAIVFLGLQLLVFPAMHKLASDDSSCIALDSKIVDARGKILSAAGVDANITKTYDAALIAAAPLLPSLDKPSLNVWLFGIIAKNGLTIQSATLGDPSPTPGPTSAVVPGADASASGSTSTGATGSASNNAAGANYAMKTYADQFLGNAPSSTTQPAAATTSTSASEVMVSTVSLKMTGSYSSFDSFLDAIRDTKRYILITSLDCSNQGANFSFSVTLDCYAAEKLDKSDNLFDWAFPTPSGQSDLMKP